MAIHSYKNIEEETGLKPYATWNLEGDCSKEILSELGIVGIVKNTLKPNEGTQIMIDTVKEKPYFTSVSMATEDNEKISESAKIAFNIIEKYIESNPKLLLDTTFYGHAKKMGKILTEKRKSLASKL